MNSLGRSSARSALALVLAAGLAASITTMPAFGRAEEPPSRSGTSKLSDAPANAARAELNLPIRKITLYRSGVGYFERSGLVDGNAEVTLRFNTEQINDILKSMVLLDLGGGRIESVSYGSKEPLAKRLASFGINIAANPSIPELFAQLRGASVKVFVAGAEITGTILGVEQRPTPPSKDVPSVQLPHLNLVTGSGVRSVAITDISSFEILDKELAGELNKALAALAEYRADRSKTVDLRFAGNGSRQVVVGYVHEMPVFKASYRLVLPDADPPATTDGKTSGQLMLQGWAIVENTTDQDWNNVKLSLVSGRPVSFQMDLYEPLFAFRPMVAVPTIPGVNPRIFALGIDEEQKDAGAAAGRTMAGMTANSMQSQKSLDYLRLDAAVPELRLKEGLATENVAALRRNEALVSAARFADYSAKAAAQAGMVGEIFQYEIDSPVSIERQRSAMIPIISTNVTGRRVSIYNTSDNSNFPMRGVEITNDSKLQLLPGPISVLDGSAYAGDAQIGQIPLNDKRLLAYALDLDVSVYTRPEDVSVVERIIIVDGQFKQTIRQRITTAYEIANKDTKRGRTMIVEHAKRGGFDLVETDKPTEQTPDLYRFTVVLEPGKAKKFVVNQEAVRFEFAAVTNWDAPTVVSYHKGGKISDKVLEAYKQVATRQSAVSQTEREIAQMNAKMKEIGDDQGRIRENITRIDRASQLYTKYMTKLTEQETQLEDLREKRLKAEQVLEQQRKDLNDFVRNLTVGD